MLPKNFVRIIPPSGEDMNYKVNFYNHVSGMNDAFVTSLEGLENFGIIYFDNKLINKQQLDCWRKQTERFRGNN